MISINTCFQLLRNSYNICLISAVSCFSSSEKIRNLAGHISLTATLLAGVSRTINNNEQYFKDSFQQIFESIQAKCIKDYEVVLAGLEKAISWKKRASEDKDEEEPPRKPWKRLLWALDINDDEANELGILLRNRGGKC